MADGSLIAEHCEPTTEGVCDMRWWEHPLVLLAWSVAVMIIYALYPSSDTTALVGLLVWGFGVIVWMAVGDALSARGRK